ncbi:MAG: DUF3800 domain-containing protein [Rhizomicrobium sp.]
MPALIVPQRIYCDEAGYTGPRLLDATQPFFVYSSVAIEAGEADDLVGQIRTDFRPQGNEIKGKNLMRSAQGRRAVTFALTRLRERYIITGYDKKLSLAGKFFEYIFEPVLAENNALFYRNNFHRFITALIYVTFVMKSAGIVELVEQFEVFMRSLNPCDAPLIFDASAEEFAVGDSLMDVAYFIQGYRQLIREEGRSLASIDNDSGEMRGKWTLDLTCSAVWSHLATWTDREHLLNVVCDHSKPLASMIGLFNRMINRPDDARFRFGDKDRRLTFNLSAPITTGSSLEHSGLQLADLVSSAFLQALVRSKETWSRAFLEEMHPHMHEDCIMADEGYIEHMNLRKPEPAVNALILRELGDRAQQGLDPLDGMELMYEIGQRSVGEFLSGAFTAG